MKQLRGRTSLQLSPLQTLIQHAAGDSWKIHSMNLNAPRGFHSGFENRFPRLKRIPRPFKSRMFDTRSEFRADAYSAMPLLWTPVVRAEKCYGQVCACTCYPWRFGSQGSTMYVVKIVLLIEHPGRTGYQCVCVCVCVCEYVSVSALVFCACQCFFSLFFSITEN